MFFIGIISDEENFEIVKTKIHRKINRIKKEKYDIINIKKDNIDNLKNIKFSSIIIHNNINGICDDKRSSDSIEKIFQNIDYLILNSDEKIELECINNKIYNTITYGTNSMATITLSSISKKGILIAIQRIIMNIYNESIEQMEYIVENNLKDNLENILAVESFSIIYGKKQLI